MARFARGVQREAQLERGGRLQGARRHARHDRQRAGHRRRPTRDQEEAMPHVLIVNHCYGFHRSRRTFNGLGFEKLPMKSEFLSSKTLCSHNEDLSAAILETET